jgi:hypothetical protein
MRTGSDTASSALYFCEINNNGNANNTNASSVGGVAPDSARRAMCRSLATDPPNAEGEPALPPVSPLWRGGATVPLIHPGGRSLHGGRLCALRPFMPGMLCGWDAPPAEQSGRRTRGFI